MSTRNGITIYDLAKDLKVSPATVSRALNNAPTVNKNTRDRIIKKARDLGYRQNLFASSLRSQRTRFIGAVVPQLNTFPTASRLAGAQLVLDELGYNLMISQSLGNMDLHQSHIDNFVTRRRVDGVLIESLPLFHDASPIQQTVPMVIMEHSAIVPQGMSYDVTYELTNLLVRQGCQRIAYLSVRSLKPKSAESVKGYLQALLDNRLPQTEELLFPGYAMEQNDFSTYRRILSTDPRPDGILLVDEVVTAMSLPGNLDLNRSICNASGKKRPDVIFPGFTGGAPDMISDQLVLHGKMAGLLLMVLIEQHEFHSEI